MPLIIIPISRYRISNLVIQMDSRWRRAIETPIATSCGAPIILIIEMIATVLLGIQILALCVIYRISKNKPYLRRIIRRMILYGQIKGETRWNNLDQITLLVMNIHIS